MHTSTRVHIQSLILAVCLLILALGFFVYGATGHDDAHINFWAAWTLLQHGEILNYNGERIEQTTSLLLDLFTVFYHLVFDLDIITAGFMVDVTASIACCWLLIKLARTTCPSMTAWPVLLLLSCSSFLLWTYGGMGATLAAFTVLSGMTIWWLWIESPLIKIYLLILLLFVTIALTLVRPEMPLITIAVAFCIGFFHRSDKARFKRCLQLLLMCMLAAITLFSWQKWYFDSWLPLPVTAKQSGAFLMRIKAGSYYLLFNGLLNPIGILALLSIPLLWWQQRKHDDTGKIVRSNLLALLATFTMVYVGFIWTAGGDWMQAGRFLVPILPAATLLLAAAASSLPWRWLMHILLGALCIFQLSMQYISVAQLSHGIPVWAQYRIAKQHKNYSVFEQLNQEHLRDMASIDHLAEIIPPLHEKLGRPIELISGQAGMVFYYTAQRFGNNVHFRDLRGLVEGSLTNCPAINTVKRGQQGLFWGYSEFFALLPTLQQECGITAPDIIYDINDMSQKMGRTLEPLGYTMIHQESGFPVENNTSLPYNQLLAPNMIFVRNDLLPLIGNPPKRVINYRELPLQTRWPMQRSTFKIP